MKNRSLVTLAGHSREKIEYLIRMAQEFERHPNRRLLAGRVVATLFFEPSTRTRLSFETAANRLGARVIGFADPKVTSGTKGETLKDTIMMVSSYADVIVMRHYLEGAALYASEVAPVPIVNAGDGANQHPSQTMLDMYTIYQTQGTLDNLNIYMVGDLKYGRTVHSLLMAMRHFNPTFHFIAPDELAMPAVYKRYCDEYGIKYVEHQDFDADTISDADILYMTRVQKERFADVVVPTDREIAELRRKAKAELPPRLFELAVRYDFLYNKVTIKHNATNWGSCSAKGNINLNLNVVRLPKVLQDYVLLHELCHLRHHDHGHGFHLLLEHVLTDNLLKYVDAGDALAVEMARKAAASKAKYPIDYVMTRAIKQYRVV
jgi:aspartate carbamoyltransferase catalytic subunit